MLHTLWPSTAIPNIPLRVPTAACPCTHRDGERAWSAIVESGRRCKPGDWVLPPACQRDIIGFHSPMKRRAMELVQLRVGGTSNSERRPPSSILQRLRLPGGFWLQPLKRALIDNVAAPPHHLFLAGAWARPSKNPIIHPLDSSSQPTQTETERSIDHSQPTPHTTQHTTSPSPVPLPPVLPA